jgi:hypothetical protein
MHRAGDAGVVGAHQRLGEKLDVPVAISFHANDRYRTISGNPANVMIRMPSNASIFEKTTKILRT